MTTLGMAGLGYVVGWGISHNKVTGKFFDGSPLVDLLIAMVKLSQSFEGTGDGSGLLGSKSTSYSSAEPGVYRDEKGQVTTEPMFKIETEQEGDIITDTGVWQLN